MADAPERPKTPCRLRWLMRDDDWVLQQAWEVLRGDGIFQEWRDIPEVSPDGERQT